MWSPSCILEQRGFQPAIVCKTRVLLIASATVRCIGVAILGSHRRACPLGSFVLLMVERATASSVLIAPAWPVGLANGMLARGGVRCCWRLPALAFALVRGCLFDCILNRSSDVEEEVATVPAERSAPLSANLSQWLP